MLQLFKERDRQIELNRIARQRSSDLAMKEHFERLNVRDKFNDHLLRGEKIRSDLKNATQAIHLRRCKENLNLCEESLSKELGEMKLHAQREEKLRQLLWETTPELRELRKKFLLATVTRDQSMQISERKALLELKRQEEISLAEEAKRQNEIREAEERRKEMEQHHAKLRYHKELDDLRLFKLQKDSAMGRQNEREKCAVDDILKKIKEEEQELERKRIEKQKAFNKQAEELQNLRYEMQCQEKFKEHVQDMKVDEYRKAQELRAKEQSEKKHLYLEQKLKIQEKLLSYLEKILGEKLRQELLRTELAVEEKEDAERTREQESERMKMILRQELQRLYEMQINVKKQREALIKKEEELYRQNMMSKLYEQDKLELMSQQRQHLKKIEHLRIVRAMIEENRNKKNMEHAKELADQKYQENLESDRAKLINEEKMRFIKDHATELLGYFPKGLFQTNKAVELLGDEFKNFYFQPSCTK